MTTGNWIALAAVSLPALGALIRLAVKTYKKARKKRLDQAKRIEALEKDNQNRKGENQVLIKATFAICDGLQQLGCNGKVTKMYEELKNYVIEN